MKHEYAVKGGKRVIVDVNEHESGEIAVSAKKAGESTVTCTCLSTGKSVTKQCPNDNNTCDCSDPNHPKIICG